MTLEPLVFEDDDAGASYANEDDFRGTHDKMIVWCHDSLMEGYKNRDGHEESVKLLEKKSSSSRCGRRGDVVDREEEKEGWDEEEGTCWRT